MTGFRRRSPASGGCARRPASTGEYTVGAIAEPLYVGRPGWDTGRRTLTGTPGEIAESLRAYRAMGVDQIQVRFRSRSRAELIEQIGVFGAEVAPRLD
ncbi:hypothetical protein GCM10017687_48630 [Streptomyces echinatus]